MRASTCRRSAAPGPQRFALGPALRRDGGKLGGLLPRRGLDLGEPRAIRTRALDELAFPLAR
jgi:hypothetical protein